MIVVDASAMTEMLLDTPPGRRVAALVGEEPIFAPQLMLAEVGAVLQTWIRRRSLDPARAHAALADLADLKIHWHDLPSLIDDAWALQGNLSLYDALYIVLARELSCTLITCNPRLARIAPDIAVLAQTS